jgi:hypothetical protein
MLDRNSIKLGMLCEKSVVVIVENGGVFHASKHAYVIRRIVFGWVGTVSLRNVNILQKFIIFLRTQG